MPWRVMKKIVSVIMLIALLVLCAVSVYALEITVYKGGDVNLDNNVDETDLQLLLDWLAGVQHPEAEKPDVNRDGTVNNIDAVLLMKYLKGYDVELYEDPNKGWTDVYQ